MDDSAVAAQYLLDTNVLSEPARPRPNPRVMARILSRRAQIATAAPVWNELHYGICLLPPSERRSRLEEYVY